MADDDAELPIPLADLEPHLAAATTGRYVLRLYVTGNAPRSTQAVESIRRTCEAHLPGRYELVVVDLWEQPERADDPGLVATPTLVKELPLPLRRLMGDLSSTNRILLALDLKTEDP